MISSYPKIHNFGPSSNGLLGGIFYSPVIVQEKLDGSNFSFMFDGTTLHFRSKSTMLNTEEPEKMFRTGIQQITELHNTTPLLINHVYRGEYLMKPKHNVLAYDRVPIRNFCVFDIQDPEGTFFGTEHLKAEASRLNLESIPVLYEGMLNSSEDLMKLMDNISFLGGAKIEGVVVKNYNVITKLNQPAMGKYVSEEFKEVHHKTWKDPNLNPTVPSVEDAIVEQYRTPARWMKAVQHLKERGELTDTPKDIAALFKEVNVDILQECEQEIKDKLFTFFWPKISRGVTRGLPEWYKQKLLKDSFGE